jgi:ABC-2 type transport system permease protein
MNYMSLIIDSTMKNNLRSKTSIAMLVGVVLICVIGLLVAFCILLIGPAVEQDVPDRSMLEMYLSLTLFAVCLIGLGVNMNGFAFQTMTREKSRGNINALLATPLEPGHIWIGKSVAVFLPGLVLGEVLAVISLLIVNFIYFVPVTGFLINQWIALSGFVAVPLIYMSLSLLVHLIGLTGRPATGNVIVQVFLPVYASLMINLAVRHVLDATSWQFTLANVGVAAVAGIIVVLLRTRLTGERIVLSH